MGTVGKTLEHILSEKWEKIRQKMMFLGPNEKEKVDDRLNYKLVENFYDADILNNWSDAIYNYKENIKKEVNFLVKY